MSDRNHLQQLQKQYEKFSEAPKYNLDSEEVFCVCRKPDHGELMVACDGCDEWFHFTCMGLDPRYKDLVNNFYCKFCDELFHKGKTIWKRKCKLLNCYKPIDIANGSQFCSLDHGNRYWTAYLQNFANPTINTDINMTEVITKEQAEILIQSMSHITELKDVGTELPIFDKGVLKITPAQKQEVEDNLNAIDSLNKDNELLSFKLNYLLKLKDVISHINELLTTSLNPDNKSNMDGNIDDETENSVSDKKRKKSKSKLNKKTKKFKVEICGFDQRLLQNDRAWLDFTTSSECDEVMNFENIDTEPGKIITETYESMKNNESSILSNATQHSILSKLCICDKRKCHSHAGWYNILKDGIDLKISENSTQIESKKKDSENLEKFIQIKNWKIYCDEV